MTNTPDVRESHDTRRSAFRRHRPIALSTRTGAAVAAGLLVAMLSHTTFAALTATDVDRLSRDRESDLQAAWSPDSNGLVFISGRGGGKNLWVRQLEGEELVQASELELPDFADQPDWSPVGPEIVFTSNQGADHAPDLWLLNLETNELRQLTYSPGIDWMPTFSPDGKQIAFVSDRGGTDDVWVINRDGSEPRRIAANGWDPAWSPQGDRIAYQSLDTATPGVSLVSASGGETVSIAPNASSPTWSPDGRRLCVIVSLEGDDQLRLINADGSTPLALPQMGAAPRSPDWSPDGTKIIYDAEADGRRNLFLMVLDYRTPEVQIAFPTDLAQLQGTVDIRGTVQAEYGALDHATVEFGPGAFPDHWQQLGDTLRNPVEDASLASWNLEGLTGAYTLRVTAVDTAGDAGVAQVQVYALSEHGVEFVDCQPPGKMTASQLYTVPLTLKNVGTMTWLNSGRYEVELGYRWLDETQTVVIRKGLLSPLPQAVEAGQSVTLEAQVKAPPLPGIHTLEFDLRQGNLLWFSDRNALTYRATVDVGVPVAAQYLGSQLPVEMTPAQEYTVNVRLLNDGSGPWTAEGEGALLLGYHWLTQDGAPLDHVPLMSRLPKTVMPEDEVTVAGRVRAPEVAGVYKLEWDLLIGEERWLSSESPADAGTQVTVKALDGVSFTGADVPRSMAPGEIYVANVSLDNTGMMPWQPQGSNAVRLGYHWLSAGGEKVEQTPLLASLPYEVPTGHSIVLATQVQAPNVPGEWMLQWDLLKGEDHWFSQHGSRPLSQDVLVARPSYAVRYVAPDHPASMIVGQPYMVNVQLTNVGTLTWSSRAPHLIKLGYHWLDKAGNEIPHEPLMVPLPVDTAYGEEVAIAGQVRAPELPGQYTLQWDLYQEGKGWFSSEGASTLNVPLRVDILYGVEFTSHDTPAAMMPSQRYSVHLRLKNLGVLNWEAEGAVPVQLSYRWLDQAGAAVVDRGLLTNLTADVINMGTIDLQAQVQAPPTPGTYILKWDLLQGGLVWFADKGATPLQIVVKVG